ncbi:hypothetical protein [Alkalibacillus salilacus]|uniref:DUF4878 domain-containing protein n=1 Tax=Alkalibacillus salilacus TaxID=284582 RepID=A0ABT9VEP1_9BACI|nr:hypothetical protein [Alkalibacillus salilacus]MDQ0159441.1 hypothetical protein [Alkalibacillus salilacus]
MKRLVMFLFVTMLVLAACNGGDDESSEDQENNQEGNEEVENEEGSDGESSSEDSEDSSSEDGSPEEQALNVMRDYSAVMEESYEASAEADFESVDEFAQHLVDEAPITEEQANEVASEALEGEEGSLTWAEKDYTFLFDEELASTVDSLELMEDNLQVSMTIDEGEEYRGNYVYNVVNVDGEWKYDNFQFGYLQGEHPDDQTEEDSEEE